VRIPGVLWLKTNRWCLKFISINSIIRATISSTASIYFGKWLFSSQTVMSEIDCWSFYEIKIQNKISLSFIIKGNWRKRVEAFYKKCIATKYKWKSTLQQKKKCLQSSVWFFSLLHFPPSSIITLHLLLLF